MSGPSSGTRSTFVFAHRPHGSVLSGWSPPRNPYPEGLGGDLHNGSFDYLASLLLELPILVLAMFLFP